MKCSEKQDKFKNAIGEIQKELKSEIKTVVEETKSKIEKVSSKAEEMEETDGVVVAAGTAIGTSIGGPIGGAVGGLTAELLTKFFVMETSTNTVKIVLDLPQVTIVDQDWIFDLPQVTIKDNDIIFNLPEIRMKRIKTGEYPEVKCDNALIPSCTVKWSSTYADIPEPYMKEHRIVIGIPEFSMREQKFIIGIPEIKMVSQSLSFDVPTITIKTREDIGKEISAEANEIAAESKILIKQKQDRLKSRIKLEIVPKAIDMLNCFKESLVEKRTEIFNAFDPIISQVSDVIKNLKAKGVPESDDDFIAVKKNFDDLLNKRKNAVDKIDQAILNLEKSTKSTLESLTK
jgi:molecular chaperone DnaK (HSP70)